MVLKTVVIFKTKTPSSTSTGGGIDSYSTLLTTRGRFRKQGSNRSLSFGEMTFAGTYELIVRYQDAIFNALRTDLRVTIDSIDYTIQSWEKLNEERFYIKFLVARA
jgi:hypothetical protein